MSITSDILSRLVDLFGGNYVPFSNRNYIVDGMMEYAISTAQTIPANTNNRSLVAMYTNYSGVGGAATTSWTNGNAQVASGIEQIPGMASPLRGVMLHTQGTASTGTVAASTAPGVWTSVEDVKTLHGRSATFSVWLWASAPMTIPSILLRQAFGSGGSPSATVVLDPVVNWAVGTVPQRFSVRVDLPSVSSKTIGTNGDHQLQIGLWFPPGVTFTVGTTQWQLEQCSPQAPAIGAPTAFDYRGSEVEIGRAKRYYESSYDLGIAPGSVANNGNVQVTLNALPSATYSSITTTVQFKTAKRAAPTITTYSPSTGAAGKGRDGIANADINTTLVNAGQTAFTISGSAAGASTAYSMLWQWVADTRLN